MLLCTWKHIPWEVAIRVGEPCRFFHARCKIYLSHYMTQPNRDTVHWSTNRGRWSLCPPEVWRLEAENKELKAACLAPRGHGGAIGHPDRYVTCDPMMANKSCALLRYSKSRKLAGRNSQPLPATLTANKPLQLVPLKPEENSQLAPQVARFVARFKTPS